MNIIIIGKAIIYALVILAGIIGYSLFVAWLVYKKPILFLTINAVALFILLVSTIYNELLTK